MKTNHALIIGLSLVIGFCVLAYAEMNNQSGRYQLVVSDGVYSIDTKTGEAYQLFAVKTRAHGRTRELQNPFAEK